MNKTSNIIVTILVSILVVSCKDRPNLEDSKIRMIINQSFPVFQEGEDYKVYNKVYLDTQYGIACKATLKVYDFEKKGSFEARVLLLRLGFDWYVVRAKLTCPEGYFFPNGQRIFNVNYVSGIVIE